MYFSSSGVNGMTWAVWFPKTNVRYIDAETPGDALRAFLGTAKQHGGGYVQLVDCIPPTRSGSPMIMRVRYCEKADGSPGYVPGPLVYMRAVE